MLRGTDRVINYETRRASPRVLTKRVPFGGPLDLVRLVKQECPGIKAVAVTGYGLPADTVTAAGFDVHLLKPVTFEQVLAHL